MKGLWNVKCFLYCSVLPYLRQLIGMAPTVLNGLFQRVFVHHFKPKFYSTYSSDGMVVEKLKETIERR